MPSPSTWPSGKRRPRPRGAADPRAGSQATGRDLLRRPRPGGQSHKFATPAWQGLYGHNKRLWQALYKVSRDSNDRNEFFLSAVVVHKDDGIPGKAFIEWCDEETPGRNWAWHMKAAHKYFRFR